MKKLASLILLSIFFMVGCQDDSSLLEPSNSLSDASSSYNKGRVILPKFITLPDEDGLAKLGGTGEGWIVEKLVKEEESAQLVIEQKYEGGIHGVVKVYVVLDIAGGTFDDDAYVALHVNDYNGVVTFKASGEMERKAQLTVYYSGIDLQDETAEDVNFEYINDGTFYPVSYKELRFDKSTGTLAMYGGVVSQYTQYGFTTLEYE